LKRTKNYIDTFGHNNNFSISYPYGNKESYRMPVPDIAQEVGHKIGFTMERGINYSDANKLVLKRFDCNDLIGGKNY